MSKASLELGGGNWAAKDGNLLGYAVGDTSGKYLPREFDFTRGGDISATRVNEDGLIEKYRENLLLQSNNFGETWDTSIDITATSGQAGYDGSNDAWLLKRSSNASRYIYQNLSASSSVYTLSFYGKPESEDWVYVYSFDGSSAITAYFDLRNEAVGDTSGSVISTNIEAAGNGYYRCSLTYNASVTQVRIYPAVGNSSITGGVTDAGIYIQDAQLEQGLVATDYLESGATTGKAGVLEDLPRIDYTGGSAQLLMEPQRENKINHSEYFGDWGSVGVDLDLGYEAPDGTKSAYKISDAGAGGGPYLVKYGIVLPTDSRSIWAKTVSGTGTVNLLTYYENTNNLFTITEEWQRFEISSVTTSTGETNFYAVDFRGDDTTLSEVIIWGAQAEAGSYATSYIPTYGVSVTRSLDSCVATSVSDLIGQNQGTMFVDITINNISGQTNDPIPISLKGSGSTNSYISLYDNGRVQAVHYGFGSIQANINLPSYGLTDGRHKFAFVYSDNDFKLYIDGALAGSDTSGLVDAQSDVHLGYYNTAFNGTIKNHQALLFPTALTDSECIALTTL